MRHPFLLECSSVVASNLKYFAALLRSHPFQIEQPSEEDLRSWGHHSDPSTVPDTILQCSAGDEVIASVHVSYASSYIGLLCVRTHKSHTFITFLVFSVVVRFYHFHLMHLFLQLPVFYPITRKRKFGLLTWFCGTAAIC